MVENIDEEIWKEIENYNGDYLISNFGRVKSFIKWNGTDERILKQNTNNKGYFQVKLYKNGETENKSIHILMFESFIEKIPEGYIIHHKDFTKNNFLDNFEMITKFEHDNLHNKGKNHYMFGKHHSEKTKQLMRENHADNKGENHPMFGKRGNDSPRFGKHHSEKTKQLMRENHADNKGENNTQSILLEQDVIEIRRLLDEGILTQIEIAKKFDVSPATVSLIKLRKIWKYIK